MQQLSVFIHHAKDKSERNKYIREIYSGCRGYIQQKFKNKEFYTDTENDMHLKPVNG